MSPSARSARSFGPRSRPDRSRIHARVLHSIALWVGFHVFVLTVLAIDLGIFHRKSHVVGYREALGWTVAWVTLALIFAAGIWRFSGPARAMNFVTGYIVEESLSVDNVFVFVMIFSFFSVPRIHQHRVLFWGILGAIVMRGSMIAAGTALLHRFEWIAYVFGAFLLITGVKMAFQRGEKELRPDRNPLVLLAARLLPVTPEYHGQALLVRRGRSVAMTPLLLVLLVVESTDIVF